LTCSPGWLCKVQTGLELSILLPQPPSARITGNAPPRPGQLSEIFFLLYWGSNLGPTPWVTPLAFFCDGFSRYGLSNYLSRLALNYDPPDLCLLSS
jgi:hypothetical protein